MKYYQYSGDGRICQVWCSTMCGVPCQLFNKLIRYLHLICIWPTSFLKACTTAMGAERSPAEQNLQLYYRAVTCGGFHSHLHFCSPFPVINRPILHLVVMKNDGKKFVCRGCNWESFASSVLLPVLSPKILHLVAATKHQLHVNRFNSTDAGEIYAGKLQSKDYNQWYSQAFSLLTEC